MLVLSRGLNEEVIITLPDGRVIREVIVRCAHGRVRIGYDAPADVKILRRELVGREESTEPAPAGTKRKEETAA